MEDALGLGLLDDGDCFQQGFLGTFDIFLLNGHPHFFYSGLHCGSGVKVSKPPFLILPGSFNCR